MSDSQLDEYAKAAFAAYNTQAGGKTWDGKDIPPWELTGPKVQENWRAAVRAVLYRAAQAPAELPLPGQGSLPLEEVTSCPYHPDKPFLGCLPCTERAARLGKPFPRMVIKEVRPEPLGVIPGGDDSGCMDCGAALDHGGDFCVKCQQGH